MSTIVWLLLFAVLVTVLVLEHIRRRKALDSFTGTVRDGVTFWFHPRECHLKIFYDVPAEGIGTMAVYPGAYGPTLSVTGYSDGDSVGYLDLFPHTEGEHAKFLIYNKRDEDGKIDDDNPTRVDLGDIANHQKDK
jgi:hypothetical protein